jgi:hypothetical protein
MGDGTALSDADITAKLSVNVAATVLDSALSPSRAGDLAARLLNLSDCDDVNTVTAPFAEGRRPSAGSVRPADQGHPLVNISWSPCPEHHHYQ